MREAMLKRKQEMNNKSDNCEKEPAVTKALEEKTKLVNATDIVIVDKDSSLKLSLAPTKGGGGDGDSIDLHNHATVN